MTRVDERTEGASELWLALALLCAPLFLDAADFTIVHVALPTLQHALGFTQAGLQWVVTIYALMFGGFLLLGGRVADLYGRRRLFSSGIALFTLGSAAAGLAPSPTVLLAGRAFQGLGAAVTAPAALSIVTHIFPPGPKRNRALAVYAAIGSAGFSLGLVLGGLITSYLGWRWIFFINLPIAVVVLALTPRFVPPSRDPEGVTFDGLGAVTITGGMLSGVYAISAGIRLGWTDPRILGTAAASVLLVVGFVIHERRVSAPLLPLDLFQRRTVIIADAAASAIGASGMSVLFFGTQYLQVVHNYSALRTGFAFLPMGITTAVVSTYVSGQLVSRYGLRPVLAGGMGLMAVGMGYLSLLPIEGSYWFAFFPGITGMAAGYGLAYPGSTVGAVADIDETRHGLASGLQQTSTQIGAGVGLALYVTIAAALTDFDGDNGAIDPSVLIDGINAAMIVAAVVAGVVMLAALTLRAGIEAESTTGKIDRDGSNPSPDTSD